MNRFIASFTKSEQQLIVSVLVILGLGCGMLQWKESRQSTLSFNIAEVPQQMPRMPKPVAPEGMNSAGLVDVNIADGKVLETLPGIGPSMAAAIMRHRESVGPIRSMDDLDKVPGIGPAMMAKLAPMVTFGESAKQSDFKESINTGNIGGGTAKPPAVINATALAPTPAPMPGGLPVTNDAFRSAPRPNAVNINTASAEELNRLKGVGPSLAQRIIADRMQNGPFKKPEDLDRVKGVGPSILRKNADMIRVD